MCISKISNQELLDELKKRGLLTNSPVNEIVIKKNTNDYKVILTLGKPEKEMVCRECRLSKPSDSFSFYQARVNSDGFLMRSNALCNECSTESNKQRKQVLDSADIPDKPKSGDICQNCERPWEGNWHRHHVEDKFIAYICGHCNMSFSDQRNKKNLVNEKYGS
jgi:hypothetical protein